MLFYFHFKMRVDLFQEKQVYLQADQSLLDEKTVPFKRLIHKNTQVKNDLGKSSF